VRGLNGRVALVPGAGAGIGAAVARRLAEEGAAVAVIDMVAEAAEGVAAEITGDGGRAIGLAADVADGDAVRAAVGATVEAFGGLSIVINIAGITRTAMLPKLDEDMFDLVVDVHLGGTYKVTRAALEHLPEDGTGRIINTTSAAGLTGTIGQANYAAAKAGIVGFTKSCAKELAKRSITANVISPMAATQMTEKIRTDPKFAEMTLNRIPLRRWAEPEEIAGAYAFLASDDASYITGQVLCVDGGVVI
jgi:3-oxoacyl-[acyl-carrier protein] reductase